MSTTNFKSERISLLEDAVPELKDKVQAGAVDEKTPSPFAVFGIPEERPIRSIHGIAGYETTFELSVYDKRFAGAESLRKQVIAILDEIILTDGQCLRYRGSSYDYYPQYDLHCVTLTFRIV